MGYKTGKKKPKKAVSKMRLTANRAVNRLTVTNRLSGY
jgi:hypothetical protein